MQQQNLTVALSPPSVIASPIHATLSDSEVDPPSYNAVNSITSPSASTTNIDGSDEIVVDSAPESPVAQQAPRRDQ